MLYLTFVRPALVVWAQYFGDRRAVMRAQSRLFFGPIRPVSPSELSRSLVYHTHRILGIKISVRLWRHVATWFLNQNAADLTDYHELSNRSALSAQLGHSEETHSLYASDARLPAKFDLHVFYQTMRISGIWHDLLGWESSLLRDMSRRKTCSRIPAEPAQQREGDPCHFASSTPMLPSSLLSRISEEVKKALLPEIVRALVQTRADDLASLLDAVGFNLQTPASQPPPDLMPITHITHPSRLRDLRLFLRDSKAAFKHPQQALATELIASRNPSILLIGPTGLSSSRCA
jgi:hypothetical protein